MFKYSTVSCAFSINTSLLAFKFKYCLTSKFVWVSTLCYFFIQFSLKIIVLLQHRTIILIVGPRFSHVSLSHNFSNCLNIVVIWFKNWRKEYDMITDCSCTNYKFQKMLSISFYCNMCKVQISLNGQLKSDSHIQYFLLSRKCKCTVAGKCQTGKITVS